MPSVLFGVQGLLQHPTIVLCCGVEVLNAPHQFSTCQTCVGLLFVTMTSRGWIICALSVCVWHVAAFVGGPFFPCVDFSFQFNGADFFDGADASSPSASSPSF